MRNAIPLCVDMDGTLLRTDLLFEGLIRLTVSRSLRPLLLLRALGSGRPGLKREVQRLAGVTLGELPLRTEVVEFLRHEHQAGRTIHLVTAADAHGARTLVEGLGLFSSVHGSRPGLNLKAHRKMAYLVEHFGEGGFDYMGDSAADLPVWGAARRKLVVGPRSRTLVRRGDESWEAVPPLYPEVSNSRQWWRALRPHQWVKNLLVFAPIVTAGLFADPSAVGLSALTFLLFSVVASGTYILNDLLDLGGDRRHPTKGNRPFATGALSIQSGLLAGPALVASGLLLAGFLDVRLLTLLAVYVLSTLVYSLRLKSAVLVDVVLLGGLYAIRIFAGAVVAGVGISFWLLSFAVFLFFSLALSKRYAEIARYPEALEGQGARRGYRSTDLSPVLALGVGGGMASIVIFALYINEGATVEGYARPEILWLLVPALLYWVSRVWIVAARGELTDDPVVWALRDGISVAVGFIVLSLVVLARYISW